MRKSALFTVLALFLATTSYAASVLDARVNTKKGVIEVDVRYGGGCKEHKFSLNLGLCLETFPVQCSADLVDATTDDFCEALNYETVEFSLKEYGLDDSYYSGGSLTIVGDDDTQATVTLPK